MEKLLCYDDAKGNCWALRAGYASDKTKGNDGADETSSENALPPLWCSSLFRHCCFSRPIVDHIFCWMKLKLAKSNMQQQQLPEKPIRKTVVTTLRSSQVDCQPVGDFVPFTLCWRTWHRVLTPLSAFVVIFPPRKSKLLTLFVWIFICFDSVDVNFHSWKIQSNWKSFDQRSPTDLWWTERTRLQLRSRPRLFFFTGKSPRDSMHAARECNRPSW